MPRLPPVTSAVFPSIENRSTGANAIRAGHGRPPGGDGRPQRHEEGQQPGSGRDHHDGDHRDPTDVDDVDLVGVGPPRPAPAGDAEGHTEEDAHRHGDAALDLDGAAHRAGGHAEHLQHGEVPPPPAGRGGQGEEERGQDRRRQGAGQERRARAHGAVLGDLGRALHAEHVHGARVAPDLGPDVPEPFPGRGFVGPRSEAHEHRAESDALVVLRRLPRRQHETVAEGGAGAVDDADRRQGGAPHDPAAAGLATHVDHDRVADGEAELPERPGAGEDLVRALEAAPLEHRRGDVAPQREEVHGGDLAPAHGGDVEAGGRPPLHVPVPLELRRGGVGVDVPVAPVVEEHGVGLPAEQLRRVDEVAQAAAEGEGGDHGGDADDGGSHDRAGRRGEAHADLGGGGQSPGEPRRATRGRRLGGDLPDGGDGRGADQDEQQDRGAAEQRGRIEAHAPVRFDAAHRPDRCQRRQRQRHGDCADHAGGGRQSSDRRGRQDQRLRAGAQRGQHRPVLGGGPHVAGGRLGAEHEGGEADHRGEERQGHGVGPHRPLDAFGQVACLLDVPRVALGNVLPGALRVSHQEAPVGGPDGAGVVRVVEAEAEPLVGGHVEVGAGEGGREDDPRQRVALVLGHLVGEQPDARHPHRGVEGGRRRGGLGVGVLDLLVGEEVGDERVPRAHAVEVGGDLVDDDLVRIVRVREAAGDDGQPVLVEEPAVDAADRFEELVGVPVDQRVEGDVRLGRADAREVGRLPEHTRRVVQAAVDREVGDLVGSLVAGVGGRRAAGAGGAGQGQAPEDGDDRGAGDEAPGRATGPALHPGAQGRPHRGDHRTWRQAAHGWALVSRRGW
jgi:hypothetical protein